MSSVEHTHYAVCSWTVSDEAWVVVWAEQRRWKVRLGKVLIVSVLGCVSVMAVSEHLPPRRSPILNVSLRA